MTTVISFDIFQSPFKLTLNSLLFFFLTGKGQSMALQMLVHGILNGSSEAKFSQKVNLKHRTSCFSLWKIA